MLLSDPSVIELINSTFVPVWESVRPVPKVTIDFGNGHILKRTLQGNTVMYACLPDGRVVDALPGVYTPLQFISEMKRIVEEIKSFEASSGNIESRLAAWHRSQVTDAIRTERMRITLSKRIVESPLLAALGIRIAGGPSAPPPAAPADLKTAFRAVSSRIEDMSHLPSTAEQIRASYAQGGRQLSAEEIGKQAVQQDSENNVRLVRPAVHMLLATYDPLPTPTSCRDTIYREILRVPIDDPNLGLMAAQVPGSL